MTKGQVIFGVGSGLVILSVAYFGFIKKDANGLTWFQRLLPAPQLVNPSVIGYAKKKGEWIGTNGKEYNKDWNSAVNSAGVTIYVKKSDSSIDSTGRTTASTDTNVYTLSK